MQLKSLQTIAGLILDSSRPGLPTSPDAASSRQPSVGGSLAQEDLVPDEQSEEHPVFITASRRLCKSEGLRPCPSVRRAARYANRRGNKREPPEATPYALVYLESRKQLAPAARQNGRQQGDSCWMNPTTKNEMMGGDGDG